MYIIPINRPMKPLMTALAAALLAVSCGDVHTPGQDITAPSVPAATGAPTQIRVLGSSRTDQQLDITAQVLTADGKGVPSVQVQFSITNGIVTPVIAQTDANGNAKTVAATFAASTITATIGTGLTSSGVFGIASTAPLSVNLTTSTVTIGTTTPFSASVSGTPIGGPFSYLFTYGDGTSDTISTSTITHLYSKSGTYTASVKVTDGSGRSVTGFVGAQVKDPVVVTPVPTPADTSGLVATLTCTANAHGTASPCNVSASYNGKALASGSITAITWDWGDGGNVAGAAVPLGSHNYLQAGTYIVTATATATTADGSKTAPIVSKSLTVS